MKTGAYMAQLMLLCLALFAKDGAAQEADGARPGMRSLGQTSAERARAMAAPASGVTGAMVNRRVALVIGNAGYQNIPKLKNSVHDAEDMCTALGKLGFDATCRYDIKTRADFRQTVRSFAAKLSPETASFFYYAGHGVQIAGENFMLPTEVSAEASVDMEDDSLNLSYLLRSLEASHAAPNIVVLDACRANPFSATGADKIGLARVDPPIGTVLVYATAPNGEAIDAADGRNGLFTKHLLAELPQAGRKLDELFQLVSKAVEQEARAAFRFKQVPYRSSSFSGSYCLAGCDDPKYQAQMEQIAQQSQEAARRIDELNQENARLQQQSEERARTASALEAKIAALTNLASSAGAQTLETRDELTRLRQELQHARAEQQDTSQLQAAMRQRESEIRELRSQMSTLNEKAAQVEEFRRRVSVLEQENADKNRITQEIQAVRRQSVEASQRIELLSQENARLKQQASERSDNITLLQRRIDELSHDANTAGSRSADAQAELQRLQTSLAHFKAEQESSAGLAAAAVQREGEIAMLRAQIKSYEAKSSQLEELRQKILQLEKANAAQSQQLKNNEAQQNKSRAVVIPSF